MRNPNLSVEAKGIYAYLAAFAGADRKCYPTIKLICNELKISKTRFYSHMQCLIDYGIVEKETSFNGNLKSKVVYQLRDNAFNHSVSSFLEYRETGNPENEETKNTINKKYSYIDVLQIFNRICKTYPRIAKLTDFRESEIQARLDDGYRLEDFEKLFEEAESSDFLKGMNKRGWQASFDWLIKRENMKKVLSGKYRNQERTDANAKQRNFKENTEKSYSFQCWE
jgi:hypothetical protein